MTRTGGVSSADGELVLSTIAQLTHHTFCTARVDVTHRRKRRVDVNALLADVIARDVSATVVFGRFPGQFDALRCDVSDFEFLRRRGWI